MKDTYHLIRTAAIESPIRSVSGDRVVSASVIRGSHTNSIYDNLYLPWMVEAGVLKVHIHIEHALDSEGRVLTNGRLPREAYSVVEGGLTHASLRWV